MSDLTARLRATYRDTYVGWLVDPTISINARCNEAADRIDALEAEVAALEFDVAALDELNITLEAECERLQSPWTVIREYGGDRHFVKPGQAVRPDGVVCDLVEATDENTAFTRSYVIDRITTDRAWILRPVVLPEGGTS